MRVTNHWKKLLKEVVGFLSLYLFQANVEVLLESTNYRAQQSQWDLIVRNRLVGLDKIIIPLDLIFMNLLAEGSYQLCQEEDEEDKSSLSWIWDCLLCNSVWQINSQTKYERNVKCYEKGYFLDLCLKRKFCYQHILLLPPEFQLWWIFLFKHHLSHPNCNRPTAKWGSLKGDCSWVSCYYSTSFSPYKFDKILIKMTHLLFSLLGSKWWRVSEEAKYCEALVMDPHTHSWALGKFCLRREIMFWNKTKPQVFDCISFREMNSF